MPYEATDLFKAIQKGINDFSHHVIRRDYRQALPEPEYLTTSSIAFSLAETGQQHPLNRYMVKCEDQTGEIWRSSLLYWFFKRSKLAQAVRKRKARWAHRQRDVSKRGGNIDIALYDNYDIPFAIIETKGLLKFTANDELYAGSRGEIDKDLLRNAEYILRTGRLRGIQYSAFTFYLTDPHSVLTSEGKAFRLKRQKYFQALVAKMNLHHDIRTHVHIGTFDDNLYESRETAMEPNHHDAPAHEWDPAWHTAYGIISLYRVGDNITDAMNLAGAVE
jgi:hypothetical protein